MYENGDELIEKNCYLLVVCKGVIEICVLDIYGFFLVVC